MTIKKSDELFEMTNVSKKDTKLPYDIWIDSEGKNRNGDNAEQVNSEIEQFVKQTGVDSI